MSRFDPLYTHYGLLPEGGNKNSGKYGPLTTSAVMLFRKNFGITTSDIFKKLMKDYGLTENSSDWENKVVDQKILVGKTKKIAATLDGLGDSSKADVLLNTSADNSDKDTGLYELHENVVKWFVKEMIAKAEQYAGIMPEGMVGPPAPDYFPKNEWYSRGTEEDNGYGPDDCVVGTECTGYHGEGMSYSFGGKQTIKQFNDTVSKWKAPPNSSYNSISLPSVENYRGNINETTGLIDASVSRRTNRWAGLYGNGSEYYAWNTFRNIKDASGKPINDEREHAYAPYYWAGIDCMGLVLRSIQSAEVSVDSVTLPDLCYNTSCSSNGPLGSDDSIINLATANFNPATKDYSGTAYYRIAKDGEDSKLIRKGDLVLYNHHIAIVYSNKYGESKYKVTKGTKYDIIHAYDGGPSRKYNEKIKGKQPVFGRKVMITGEDISNPTGFARIKIWE